MPPATLELHHHHGSRTMLLLAEVTGYSFGLDLRDAATLVAEECGPILRSGHRGGSLS